MKQILQNMSSGETRLVDVPAPKYRKTDVLIQTSCSLISIGTERMLVEFGKANILSKARQQPEKVKMVLEKVKTDGLATTIDAVKSKLDQPLALGYCNVGKIIEVHGSRFTVHGLKEGDRVASNGKHAEVVSVPINLCAKIPDNVSDEDASFTVLGSIGLEGIRLAAPTLGESFVVTGLGLIGLLTVQLLRAHGCRVLGIDFDETKLDLARRFGAETVDLSKGEDPLGVAQGFSRGRGVDAVIIAASTKSSEPVSQAARMCRKRGRIVLVGVTGLELNRADFYKKEISFQVSCSYGPGRYDFEYEKKGRDYPVGFVRWTEQRNFEAVLDMMADGRLDVAPLISHRFSLDDAPEAYRVLSECGGLVLGILLEYPEARVHDLREARTVALSTPRKAKPEAPRVSFVGAGNYAGRVLIPAFRKAGAELNGVASSGGVSSSHYGRKYGFSKATTDSLELIRDVDTTAVVIVTRHDTHADLVVEALKAGKHVFVEKPLALSRKELDAIATAYAEAAAGDGGPLLMVGFNRRFAPQVRKMKTLLESVSGPKTFVMTVNAGAIPADHWTQDPIVGGGRIIGEACHFFDLLRFLAGAATEGFKATYIGGAPGVEVRSDKMSVTLNFVDGSFGTVHYLANGSKSFPKERLEVFCAGRVLQLDNFRKLKGYGWPGFRKMNLLRQDKGQAQCAAAFVQAVEQGGVAPIPFDELMEVSRVTIEVAESLR
ncbi:MAG TPA: dehydrogenase [Phycisphaerales bacterium]|nr:dehydrogenase [Phycisphaerales bacterium]